MQEKSDSLRKIQKSLSSPVLFISFHFSDNPGLGPNITGRNDGRAGGIHMETCCGGTEGNGNELLLRSFHDRSAGNHAALADSDSSCTHPGMSGMRQG